MSVLFKGMEMPRHCGECSLLCDYDGCYFCGYEDGLLYTFGDCDFIPTERPEKCPLVEVPTPHGRLIDASQFEVFGYDAIEGSFDEGVAFVLNRIDDAPTVIEEEE